MKHDIKSGELELSALKKIFEAYLDHDVDDLETLVAWCRRPADSPQRMQFKQQLRTAIDRPGLLSPQTFESWTNVSMDDQPEMQKRLQTIWNECFPGEAIS